MFMIFLVFVPISGIVAVTVRVYGGYEIYSLTLSPAILVAVCVMHMGLVMTTK